MDLTVTRPSSMRVGLVAHNIPPGTLVNLQCFTQGSAEQSLKSRPLVGTDRESRTTVIVQIQAGKSRCFAIGDWNLKLSGK